MTTSFDYETTTHSKGSAFDQRNKSVCIGIKVDDQPTFCSFENIAVPIDDLVVGFNIKFDLHWLRKNGHPLPTKIWCCQVAEFILSGQTTPYPSLDKAAEKYGLGQKLDIVKLDYWDKGVQTDQIPREVLSEYCCLDVDLTYKVYQQQLAQFIEQPKLFALFKLAMHDLLVLEEMEWNGIKYNKTLCEERSALLETQILKIKTELASIYPDIPINFGSGDMLSAFLYGGTIKQEAKEHVGFFKTGAKAGQPKYKNVVIEHKLPRLIEPLPKSEVAKIGTNEDGTTYKLYQTNEPTLRKLKGPAAKKFVGPLLELAKLDKLTGTYYKGIPEKAQEQHWEEAYIHGQFNQVVAATGRLSSSGPKLNWAH